ncbi:hypothetical protein BaRGS_00002669 [Batillaria attramentaria]|uniref:Uncharacterized protein n=1 Tax=Batillaria attramentaria TaxID=370345 RepID=A0ABD0M400_9CAEN
MAEACAVMRTERINHNRGKSACKLSQNFEHSDKHLSTSGVQLNKTSTTDKENQRTTTAEIANSVPLHLFTFRQLKPPTYDGVTYDEKRDGLVASQVSHIHVPLDTNDRNRRVNIQEATILGPVGMVVNQRDRCPFIIASLDNAK